MADVRFADVLFIILICLLIWGAMVGVNRGKRNKSGSGNESTAPKNHQGTEED